MGGRVPLLRVLGPIEAEIDGASIDLGGPRQRSVLALLVAARGEVVSVDRIIDDLWNSEPPPKAIGALQAYISNLRRALEPDRLPRNPAQILISAAPGYAMRLPAPNVDAWHAEQLLRNTATLTHPRACDAVRNALSLWHGPAFAEFADQPWVVAEAERLNAIRASAREQLVDLLVRTGEYSDACIEAESLTRDDPLREEGWRLLALSQYMAARQADALATLRRARALLAAEIGVDLDPRLAELESAILNHAVDALPPLLLAMPTTPETSQAEQSTITATQKVFVGRTSELSAIRDAAVNAASGHPAVVAIAGEAGQGKSMILERAGADLVRDGWLVVVGRCPELEGGSSAWAMVQALRSLARTYPPSAHADRLAALLSDADVEAHEEGGEGRFLLHQAICEWLDGIDQPLAILLDDVHRADTETARMLLAILTHRPKVRMLVVVAHRPESSPGLEDLLAGLAPFAPTRVGLAGLNAEDATILLISYVGHMVSSQVLGRVIERTDGNPFFVAELGRLIAAEGEDIALSDVPIGVTDVVRRRVARLPESTVTILRLASVIGRTVDVDVLIAASNADEEATLTALEGGVIEGLLVDDEPGHVRFGHVLARDAIHADVPAVRRRSWHESIGRALEQLDRGDASVIAHHAASAATSATARHAADRCLLAAGQAEQLYAYDTAAELYDRALECMALARPAISSADRAAVAMRHVRSLALAGRVDALPAARVGLLHMARKSGDPDVLARALVAGTVPSSWPERQYMDVNSELISDVDQCLARTDLDAELRLLLLVTRCRESAYTGDPRTAEVAAEAVSLGLELDDPRLLAMAIVAQSEAIEQFHDLTGLRRNCIQLREVAERAGLLEFIVLADLKELAIFMTVHEPARCAELLERAADLASKVLPRTQMSTGFLRAALAHLHGDLSGAEANYADAFPALTRLSARDGVVMDVVSRTELAVSRGSGVEDTADMLQFLFDYNPPDSYVLGGALACSLLARGDRQGAQAALVKVPPTPDDPASLMLDAFTGLAYAGLGDATTCADSYARLAEHTGAIPGAPVGFPMIPMDLILAQLARVMRRIDLARIHLDEARRIAEIWGNAPWLALIDHETAELAAPG